MEGVAARPIDARADGARSRSGAWIAAAGGLGICLSAILFAALYVSSERSIYTWDWSLYWNKFGLLGHMLRTDLVSALAYISWSIGNEDYTVLPLVPLMPFEFLFGAGRLSYILAITTVSLLPSAALTAWIAERTEQRRSWARFLLCVLAVLCLHVLWVPALRGMPDVLGVAIACAILLAWFGKPIEQRSILQLVGIGLLLAVLVLTRRWYLFWAVSFFPAAIVAQVLGTPKDGWNWSFLKALAIAGAACGLCLLVLAAPLIIRIATTDYSAAYAAYRPELAGAGPIGQVVAQFGLATLAVSAGGLAWLAIRPATRKLGLLLVVQAAISLILFARVQGLFGPQHFYLLVPAAGIGIAAAVIGIWDRARNVAWRAAGIGAILAALVASSVAALSPVRASGAPLLPRNLYPPLVRPDLAEIDRLLNALQGLRPERVYVVSSSETLNWDTLQSACRPKRLELCKHLAVTADIDTRDGFPRPVMEADTLVLATPTQFHVRPEDQQVVGLIARDIREGRGIGTSFERLPEAFTLRQGVKVEMYRRARSLRPEDVKALSDELIRSYPKQKALFAL